MLLISAIKRERVNSGNLAFREHTSNYRRCWNVRAVDDGALSATYVKIKTPLHITTGGGNTIVLQDMLDKIVPNMLPLIAVLGIYFYIQKCGPHFLRILVTILVLSLAFSFFGLL